MKSTTQGTAAPATMNKVKEVPGLPLMTPAGEKMASHTAPSSAFEVRTTSTPAVKDQK
jgi:hypothetical protein